MPAINPRTFLDTTKQCPLILYDCNLNEVPVIDWKVDPSGNWTFTLTFEIGVETATIYYFAIRERPTEYWDIATWKRIEPSKKER